MHLDQAKTTNNSSQSPVNRIPTRRSPFELALKDIVLGLKSTNIWAMLAWQEIKQRYKRSIIGPLWLTISTAVLIGAMGPLYGRLFSQDTSAYLPHLAVSYIIWALISNLLNECCNAFINAESLIKQVKLPLTTHVLRVVWRNFIVFGHQSLVFIFVLIIFPPRLSFDLLLVPLGIGLLLINAVWVGILLGSLCARFRDIPPIISSFVQVAFFLTPVLWQASSLGHYAWVVNFNPLYHAIEVIRAPLLSAVQFPWVSLAVSLLMAILGLALTLAFFTKYRARIAYWV
ncbi:MAG: ABC transporter permease [Burkholderiales bacterium]